MRILGGSLAGTILRPNMKSWPTRPTTDMAKEALYNILMNRIDFAQVTMLDLFGGTGVHSLEFLSRGCPKVVYVDKYGPCVRWIKDKVDQYGFKDCVAIHQADVKKYLKNTDDQFDIVFADPPYDLSWLNDLPELIFEKYIIAEGGSLIIEHRSNHKFNMYNRFGEVRKYGSSHFSFFN